jgi:hypothetical protein
MDVGKSDEKKISANLSCVVANADNIADTSQERCHQAGTVYTSPAELNARRGKSDGLLPRRRC